MNSDKEQNGILSRIVNSIGGVASALQQIASFIRAQTLSHSHTGGTDGQQIANAGIIGGAGIVKSKLAFSGVKLFSSVAQTINNITWTTLSWNSEEYDTDNYHSTVSNTNRITIATAGYYRLFGKATFVTNATGLRVSRFLLNGATIIAYGKQFNGNASADTIILDAYLIRYFNAADYITFDVYHSSGGTLDVSANVESSLFICEFLGA